MHEIQRELEHKFGHEPQSVAILGSRALRSKKKNAKAKTLNSELLSGLNAKPKTKSEAQLITELSVESKLN